MARIENHQYTIEEAFRECFYIVPDYQREYVWTEKEVHQLLDDIDEQLDVSETREYFVGMVLVSPSVEKNHYEVIDGQQRLTTFFLLLCALKNLFQGEQQRQLLEGLVILLDCPGWGLSDSVVVTGSRSELNARATRALMEHLGIARADFIGNSMGAHSTVAFTLTYPDAVRRIVLMGGGVSGPSIMTPMPAEGIKLIQALYRNPTIENLKKMMQVFVYDSSALTDALFQARLDNMLARKEHLENFVQSLDANPRQFPDQSHRLSEIKAPALVIWGRDDRFMPLDLGLRLIWGLKDSQLHVFSQCGHWAQWEHADAFNQLVGDFLQ